MTIQYTVSYGSTANGPWTQFGSAVTSLSEAITGLTSGVAYYFEVIAQDTATSLSSPPTIIGPITTTAAHTESAQGTTITAVGGGPIYDAGLTAWTLVSSATNGNQISHGGVIDGAQVVLLLYWNHVIYQQNASGNWFYWNVALGPAAYTQVTGDPRVSPSGTTIVSAGGTGGYTSGASSITDSAGIVWTLVPFSGTNPYGQTGTQIAINGVVDVSTASVQLLLFYNNVIYQQNTASNWYQALGGIGNYSQIAGDPRTTSGVVTPPIQAINAGYTTNVFNADFTAATDISTAQGVLGKFYAWVPGFSTVGNGTPPSWYSLDTSGTGNLTVKNNYGSGQALSTVNSPCGNSLSGPVPVLSTPSAHAVDVGNGICFQYGYYEARILLDFSLYNSGASVSPSWWSWSVEAVYGPLQNSSLDCMEFDFMEVGVGGFFNQSTGAYCSTHEYTGSNSWFETFASTYIDNNSAKVDQSLPPKYNRYGFLWTPTNTQYFYNDYGSVQLSNTAVYPAGYLNDGHSTGPANRAMIGTNQVHIYLILGADPLWNMTVDWCRVWQ